MNSLVNSFKIDFVIFATILNLKDHTIALGVKDAY